MHNDPRPPQPDQPFQDCVDVAVVIPVRLRRPQDHQDLAACLAALARCRPRPAQCVVVDDGSTSAVVLPDVLPDVLPVGTRLIRQEPSGPGLARNAGAAATTAPVLVFVDADVCVPADALGRLQAHLDNHEDAVAVWATVAPTHPSSGSMKGSMKGSMSGLMTSFMSRYKLHTHRHFTRQLGSGPGPWSTPHLTTMLAAVRRPAFDAVGGFSTRWQTVSVEDVELGRDLVDAGGTVLLDPDLEVVHAHRFTLLSAARNDVHKIRRLVTANLIRKHQGSAATAGNSPTDRRMRAYALSVPLGVGAVACALTDRKLLCAGLLVGLAIAERDLVAELAHQEGPAFAAAAVPVMAIERCTALAAGALGLSDYLRSRVRPR